MRDLERRLRARVLVRPTGCRIMPVRRAIGDEGVAAGLAAEVERLSIPVVEDRYCIDVLIQISAVPAALDKVALGSLEDHAQRCVMGAADAEREEKTAELMAAVGRLMRRG